MGEDLLEPTHALERPSPLSAGAADHPEPAESAAYNIQEELQRGEIFYQERLFEDAKKVFRKVLRHEPNNQSARGFLDEIQRQEVQELLGEEPPRKRLGAGSSADDSPADVLEKLERDLQISVDKSELKAVPDLFETQNELDRYGAKVLATLRDLVPQDRIDIGIAHLEMGLFQIAERILETVVRYDEFKLQGMYLLGLALIYGGKPIEATIRLEPLCRDLTLGESTKTDYLYLMGMAFERLGDTRKAREFYRRAFTLNPKYRDVVDKLK